MPEQPEDSYLLDLIEAAQDARRAVCGRSVEEWHADDLARWAVIAWLMVIGEAANRLARLHLRYDAVPWRQIVAFRNFVVHQYFEIEWHVVREITVHRLPELIENTIRILCAEYPDLVAGSGGPRA